MNFSSIKEYFYKLYNVCFLFLLLPLVIFIFIYYQLEHKKITPLVQDEQHVQWLVALIVVLCIVNLTTVHLILSRRLKIYAAAQGLGHKLDRYHETIFVRYAGGATACLLIAIGFLLSGNEWFPIIFLLILLTMGLQWPTSRRVCNALKLKGDEYKMVFHKDENIK